MLTQVQSLYYVNIVKYFVAKNGFDTAEDEQRKVGPLSLYGSLITDP